MDPSAPGTVVRVSRTEKIKEVAVEFLWQGISRWLPIVVLVGLWLYFMTKIRASRRQELVELLQHMKRLEVLLDRIAGTLERRTTT